MGCDIHGFIEVQKLYSEEEWESLIDVGFIVGRNYNMFAIIAGVRNYSGYTPMFEQRGLPNWGKNQVENKSWDDRTQAQKELERWSMDAHSHTWFTWKELKEKNWDESKTDAWITVMKEENGKYVPDCHSFTYSSELDGITKAQAKALENGEMITHNDKHYQRLKQTAKEQISDDWQLCFDLMERLAKQYGDDKVRMVIWFDN